MSGRALAFAALGFGLLFGAAAATPLAALQRGGELLRHAHDVTPERVARWRLWCGAMAATFGMAAWRLRRDRAAVATFRADAAAELRGGPGEIAAAWRRQPAPWKWTWLGIVACGLGLRLWHLNAPMAYDEAYSFTNFARRPLAEALSDYNNTNNHLLNTLGMHVCWRLFGNHEWALRLPALLGGMACVLIAWPWAARRVGSTAALAVAALLAASPMLVDYSTNARGYTLMLAAALVVDWCLLRIAARQVPRAASWLGAWVGIVAGLFALPVMLHPLAGLCLWFCWRQPRRWRGLALLLALAAWGTAALYGPAFVFRGNTAARHDFVQPLPLGQWAAEFPGAVAAGAERWCVGPLPFAAWLALAAAGFAAGKSRGAFLAMALGGMALLALQRVAPPPRMFLFLTPWFFVLVTEGWVALMRWIGERLPPTPTLPPKREEGVLRGALWLALAALLPGVWHCLREPILREPQQRDFGIGSVPAAVAWLSANAPQGGSQRLLAPLPLDHPAIYYADRHGLALPINGTPQPGETLWRLAVRDGAESEIAGWEPVAIFPELNVLKRSKQ